MNLAAGPRDRWVWRKGAPLEREDTMTIRSTTKTFAGLVVTLTIIAGTTAAAQAGGGKTSGIRTSGVTLAQGQSGPVVRDHRGQGSSGTSAPTPTSGWNGQVRDHRGGGDHEFCFGGFIGGTQCAQF